MALPDLSALKAHLKIETTAEDTALTSILEHVKGMVEQYLGRPITAASVTTVDYGAKCGTTKLLGFYCPIDTGQTITVKDRDETTLDSDTYTVDAGTGVFRAEPGVLFGNPPYTLTFTAGLSARADYATVVEPALSLLVLDLAADYWRRRVGSVAQASSVGDSESYSESALPKRAKLILDSFRLRQL